MTEYQVIAEMAAHVEVQEPGGTSVQTFYKGAMVPDGVPAERIKGLLDRGIIAKVGEVPIAPNAAVAQDPARGIESVTTETLQGQPAEEPQVTGDTSEEVAAVVHEEASVARAAEAPRPASDEREAEAKSADGGAAKRAAAKAKLPADGSAPDGRAGQPVWAEYLVARGSRYADVKDADKDELIKLAKQQQS
jgi:hypothetical protein